MLAVVFVHYDLPIRRLREHYEWNSGIYEFQEIPVFTVTDNHWYVGDKLGFMVQLRYPHELPLVSEARSVAIDEDSLNRLAELSDDDRIFSLSATKNHGIQHAIDAGYDRIAATDADIAWTPEAIEACKTVGPKEVIVPIYRMAQTFETRHEVSHPDHGCGGTICMTAENWKRQMYDERYVGYGGEDGRLRRDIGKLAIHENRETEVFHIAHDPTASQVNVPGAGRADCWNRDTINPDNWAANRLLINK